MFKRITLILLAVLGLASAGARVRALEFENPGSRRLLKTEAGNHWYYRSRPEKTLTLNVDGISEIELRSFAIARINRPRVIVISDTGRNTYDLIQSDMLDGYRAFAPVKIAVPPGSKTIQILCYERSIYFRAFHTLPPAPKPKAAKAPNLQIRAHGGILSVTHNGTDSDYHVFNPSQSLKFSLNNQRNGIVYVRARLLDRTLPEFELYRNGELVESYEFSLLRTTKYKAVGIDHLTTGMKLELPANNGSSDYELRAVSDHLFLARPLVLRAN
ncbi:MAG: hypothetical protein K0B87_04195 [Candidatus Syntrophosphaera sp.]|nr:hypothetical protein [Candidatus Syntrophosphaera sp.]